MCSRIKKAKICLRATAVKLVHVRRFFSTRLLWRNRIESHFLLFTAIDFTATRQVSQRVCCCSVALQAGLCFGLTVSSVRVELCLRPRRAGAVPVKPLRLGLTPEPPPAARRGSGQVGQRNRRRSPRDERSICGTPLLYCPAPAQPWRSPQPGFVSPAPSYRICRSCVTRERP